MKKNTKLKTKEKKEEILADNPKAVIFSVHLETFPPYFEFTKKTAKFNKDYKWIIFTDQVKTKVVDENIELIPYSLEQLNKDVKKLLGSDINITSSKKVNETKILWGAMFEKYIQECKTEWYGWSQLDVIYGDFNFFLPDEAFKNYELITFKLNNGVLHGPFTLWKNTERNRNIYKNIPKIKEVIASEKKIEETEENLIAEAVKDSKIENYPGWEAVPNRFVKICQGGTKRVPAKWEENTGKVYLQPFLETKNGEEEKDIFGHTMILHVKPNLGISIDEETNEVVHTFIYEYRKNKKELDTFIIKDDYRSTHLLYLLTEYLPTLHYLVENYQTKKLVVGSEEAFVLYKTYLNLLKIDINIEVKKNLEGKDSVMVPKFIEKKYIQKINSKIDIQKEDNIRKVLLLGKKQINDKIKEELIANGFNTVKLENLTAIGQARLFKSSDILVITNEPEMGNIIFTSPKQKIIQLTDGKPVGSTVNQLESLYKEKWDYQTLPNQEESVKAVRKIITY